MNPLDDTSKPPAQRQKEAAEANAPRRPAEDFPNPREAAPFTDLPGIRHRRPDVDLTTYRDIADSSDESQQTEIDEMEHGTGAVEGNARDTLGRLK